MNVLQLLKFLSLVQLCSMLNQLWVQVPDLWRVVRHILVGNTRPYEVILWFARKGFSFWKPVADKNRRLRQNESVFAVGN